MFFQFGKISDGLCSGPVPKLLNCPFCKDLKKTWSNTSQYWQGSNDKTPVKATGNTWETYLNILRLKSNTFVDENIFLTNPHNSNPLSLHLGDVKVSLTLLSLSFHGFRESSLLWPGETECLGRGSAEPSWSHLHPRLWTRRPVQTGPMPPVHRLLLVCFSRHRTTNSWNLYKVM